KQSCSMITAGEHDSGADLTLPIHASPCLPVRCPLLLSTPANLVTGDLPDRSPPPAGATHLCLCREKQRSFTQARCLWSCSRECVSTHSRKGVYRDRNAQRERAG